MKKSLIWRFVVIAIILVGWTYSMFPLTERPFFEGLRREAKNIDEPFETLLKDAQAEIDSKIAEGAHGTVNPPRVTKNMADNRGIQLSKYIEIYGQTQATNQSVINYVRRKCSAKLRLGLDLRGGTEFIVEFTMDDGEMPEERTAEQVRDEIMEIIRNRIDQSGVVEPEIRPVAETAISVKIPFVNPAEVQEIREIMLQAAVLKFHFLVPNNDELVAAFQASPETFRTPPNAEKKIISSTRNGQESTEVVFISKRAEKLTGRQLVRAVPSVNEFGTYAVNLEFDPVGTRLFAETTKAHVGERMAIVLDGKVYSAPNIREEIPSGRAEISGSFTPEEANKLSIVLRCGNLPATLRIGGEFSTAPTLGHESVVSGRNAASVGLILVFVFMLAYYFTAGVVASIALAANIVLVLGTLTIAGATITLPGIAGIVLTIGMAVDANVLIFERIREELANKKSLGNAIATGYARALVTILDANLTTLLTALILYNFGSGPIRGFAVTLSIGIVASLFTALFVTRAVFDLLLHNEWLSQLKMMHLLSRTQIDFLGLRKLAVIGSSAMVLIALIVVFARGDGALSVDFRGGYEISFNYDQQVPIDEIRTELSKVYDSPRAAYKASMQKETRLLEIVISDDVAVEDHEGIRNTVLAQLNKAFPDAGFGEGSTKEVGSLVGSQFRKQAAWAVIWSMLGIIIYITFRFEFAYALGAVVALIHDVTICLGVFLVCPTSLSSGFAERQLSLPVIAALLTIIGYSLNDTIVVFDRVRENLGLKKMGYLEVVNLSLNQTLSRTVMTSLTTLIVVVVLFIFGGGAINDFALVMLAGVVIGTYSSLFVATPAMILYRNWSEARHRAQAEADAEHKKASAQTAS